MAVVSVHGRFGRVAYLRTFSDRGMMIHCKGEDKNTNYIEAIDTADTKRVYVETDIPVSCKEV